MVKRLYALLVGINDYDARSHVPSLRGCVNDVLRMEAYLKGRVATDEFDLQLQVLTNEQATRSGLVEGFRTHLAQASADDVVLFYYAGHGAQAIAPEEFWPIEPDRMLETLVCYDSRIDDDHWDLADKELAKLIAEVDKNNPHIVVVLDCCHSGSGTRGELAEVAVTRGVDVDRRPRPIESFIVSPADALSAEDVPEGGAWSGRTRSVSPTAMKLPVGRHVVISACQSIEEAKEYYGDDQFCGVFSYFFQASLAKANGALSYRDLFKRTNALVRSNVPGQSPQMDATHSQDLEQPFLGGAIAPSDPYFTASHHREHGWVIDGGAIHGLRSPVGEDSFVLALFPFDSGPEQLKRVSEAIAQASITKVLPQLSHISSESSALADTSSTFKAVVISSPLPPLTVYFEGEEAGSALLSAAIATAGPTRQSSLYVQAVGSADLAHYRVMARGDRYSITPPHEDRLLVTPVQGYTAISATKVVQDLEHIARWKTLLELSSPASTQIEGTLKLAIYTGDSPSHETATEIVDSQIRLSYTFNETLQEWVPPRFRIRLHNTSNQTLYCALLYLTERFKVEVIKPDGVGSVVQLLPDGDLWFAGGGVLKGTISDALWQQGITECQDILKLVACTEDFDPLLLNLNELGLSTVRATTRSVNAGGSLNQLMRRVHTRDIGMADKLPAHDDWVTNQVAFTFVRPQLAQPIGRSAAVPIGDSVAIAPHPAFTANARLTTTAQSTRDLNSFTLPPLLRNQTEPFHFTQSRNSDPGLSVLALSNISQAEAVTTEQPLIVETDIPLNEGEYVLPIAYDGEFYLPLGYSRQRNGSTQIVIERLTAPVSEGRRSVQGAIRIFFQKVITKKLGKNLSKQIGVTFDYPLLAIAELDVPASEVVYLHDIEAIKAKVAQANTIVLYVHGIFGDTEAMLPSLHTSMAAVEGRSRAIGQFYDLVLTFDYENINTSIEQNAHLLKQRLEAVGLGENHKKMLHVVAHSMGGLVSRWFIEQAGGHKVVSHLTMLGTPNAGSPWPQVQAGATAAVSFALNGLSVVAAPLRLLEGLLKRIETVDISLDQMQPGSDFLEALAQSKDPGVPYTLVVGNTALMPKDETAGLKQKILGRLGKIVEIPFFKQPNDIAVLVESITAVPEGRSPAPKLLPTACNHLEYFVHPAGLASLAAAVVGTGVIATVGSQAVDQADDASVPAALLDTLPTTSSEPSSGDGVKLWVVGLVAIALAGLGIIVWSYTADRPSPPPPVVEPTS